MWHSTVLTSRITLQSRGRSFCGSDAVKDCNIIFPVGMASSFAALSQHPVDPWCDRAENYPMYFIDSSKLPPEARVCLAEKDAKPLSKSKPKTKMKPQAKTNAGKRVLPFCPLWQQGKNAATWRIFLEHWDVSRCLLSKGTVASALRLELERKGLL